MKNRIFANLLPHPENPVFGNNPTASLLCFRVLSENGCEAAGVSLMRCVREDTQAVE